MVTTGESGGKRKKRGREAINSAAADVNHELDPNLSSDIKGIIAALQHIRDKAQKDGQKRTEEIINGVASEIKSILDEAKSKCEKERQNFIKAVTKTCRECENALKNESVKFQSAYEKFAKEKSTHLLTYKEIFSKFEDEKEKLFVRYEQQRKKEKTALLDLQKVCGDKITAAEDSLKKKKQDDKSFSILRKSLGSFLESGSDEDELDE